MVAATRSGAGTPNKNDTPTTPSRKTPQCRTCKRPRAGHPRVGCPYVDSPAVAQQSDSGEDTMNESCTPATPSPARRETRKLATDLNQAMGSMNLGSSPNFKTEEDKRTLQNRRRSRPSGVGPLNRSDTLLSLTSASQELVEKLLQPGVLSDEMETEDNGEATGKKNRGPSRVVKWQETIQAAFDRMESGGLSRPKSSPTSPMPGTLITPTASFFESHDAIAEVKPSVLVATRPTETSFSSNASVPVTAPVTAPLREVKPLARTMSMEERQDFITRLRASSNLQATIFVLPKADVAHVAQGARDVGFSTQIAENQDERDDQAFLILGSQEVEVEKVAKRIEALEGAKQGDMVAYSASSTSLNQAPEKPRSSSSAFKAAAGGAVVGAVGLWAGLAFS